MLKRSASSTTRDIDKNVRFQVILSTSTANLVFTPIELTFQFGTTTDVFTRKTNKSVLETLQHNRYRSLYQSITQQYRDKLLLPLGSFLQELKSAGDTRYKEFLNDHGDEVYSTFKIRDATVQLQKGLYCFTRGAEIKYIGRCNDNFRKRINQGYGIIHPKNCYRDGQSTNCHLNSLVTQHRDAISFNIHPLQDRLEINRLEKELIQAYQPVWNRALHRSTMPLNDAG